MDSQRQQHARDHRSAQDQTARKIIRFGHGLLVG
jgi:hypothetical protein